ncbi:MAG TPA: hypothetical protein VK427_11010, partial [Kofleriaceae bacterium]|nr:hypothetical protein [Kofleriaceae bacterium]
MTLALEDAIAEDPYDETAWSVFEDWLLEQGGVRAELVQLAKAKRPADAALTATLLGEHHAALARIVKRPAWRAGYLLECTYVERDEDLAAAFYAAPATRLLRRITFQLSDLDRLGDHVADIADAPCRRSLRRIVVESHAGDASVLALVDAAQLAAIPRLTALFVEAPVTLRGHAELSALRDLEIAVTRDALPSWLAQRFPALVSLQVYLAGRSYPRLAAELTPLLGRVTAPVLEQLVLHTSSADARAVRELVERSALRPQLRVATVNGFH